MDKNTASKLIAEVFNEISDGIKSGSFRKKVRIGLTVLGSEHGIEEMLKAAALASKKYKDFDIVLIGPKNSSGLETVEANTGEEGHKLMIKLLENKDIDGCVTQHFDFPIGVSTVGKVATPSKGKEMFIATTTGTSAIDRVEAMTLNAISGIAAAKAMGIEKPTLGILNVEGSRKVLKNLESLIEKGYDINLCESLRQDGGAVMRGNDLLAGSPDVMVCDSLTGNLLIKILSSFTTGGDYETVGAGYGPGIGENYDKLVNIVSRASGAPVICEALKYCADCAGNSVLKIAENEFKAANSYGLKSIINGNTKENTNTEEIIAPPKKVVTYTISGIDILELDNACRTLWKEGIYSESGMGCTGPIILVSEDEGEKAAKILKNAGF
jgi:hypothetical protein